MALGLLLTVLIFYVAYRYTDFAMLDIHHGTRASKWVVGAYAGMVWALFHATIGLAETDPSKAASAMMIAAGMLVGVAIAPPWRAPPEEGFGARLRLSVEGMVSGALMKKLMALGAFAVASLIGQEAWILVAAGMGALLLVSKGFAMAALMQGSQSGKRLPSPAVGVGGFCILMGMGPYTWAATLPLEPASWSGFLGLGIGVLVGEVFALL